MSLAINTPAPNAFYFTARILDTEVVMVEGAPYHETRVFLIVDNRAFVSQLYLQANANYFQAIQFGSPRKFISYTSDVWPADKDDPVWHRLIKLSHKQLHAFNNEDTAECEKIISKLREVVGYCDRDKKVYSV